jgi:hypothetical protein
MEAEKEIAIVDVERSTRRIGAFGGIKIPALVPFIRLDKESICSVCQDCCLIEGALIITYVELPKTWYGRLRWVLGLRPATRKKELYVCERCADPIILASSEDGWLRILGRFLKDKKL